MPPTMSIPWLKLLGGVSGYGVAGLVVSLVVVMKLSRPSKLDAIPTVGPSSWIGSWWAGFRFLINGLDVIQEGYDEYKRAPYKVAAFDRWLVVVSSREHMEELRRAPEDTLSLIEYANDELQADYTFGPEVRHNPYHIGILHSQISRNIGVLCPEIRDEIITAFGDILHLRDTEWKNVPAPHIVETVVCRVTNRLFVGLPLCRDPDWIDLSIHLTLCVFKGALILRLFPTFLKPLAARLFTQVAENSEHARKLAGPIIEERLRHINEYGNQCPDRPNDFLSWLIDEAKGRERTVEVLTARILAVSIVAIQTSSISFTNVLFYLAANPQYIQPLREEVEPIVHQEGWSKAALGNKRRVDSFLRECQRMEGVNTISLTRKALNDFTFSDGTFVPKGTTIVTPARCIHYDEAFYPNAHVFEPFRFVGPRQADGEDLKHQYVSTTAEYLPFGYGRHACPGRFFVAAEFKSMLAHIVMTYDVKLEDDTPRPQAQFIGTSMRLDPNAKVMFRRRVD